MPSRAASGRSGTCSRSEAADAGVAKPMTPSRLALALSLLPLPAACSDAGTLLPAPDASADTGLAADARAGEAGEDASADVPVLSAPTLALLVVSTGSLVPVFVPTVTDYSVTSLNSLYPVSVTATTTDPGATLTSHGQAATSGKPTTFTPKPRENIQIVVQGASGAPSRYVVHYVPLDMPAYTVSTTPDAGAGTEDVLLTPASAYALMVDRAGNPLYYRTFPPQVVENLAQVTLPDSTVVYTCGIGTFNPGGWTLGTAHVMDQHFNDLDDFQLLAHAQHGVLPTDGHDFILLDHQHYIALTYFQRTVDLSMLGPDAGADAGAWSSSAQVMSAIVQEVDSGNVLLEWDSADVPSLYADSLFSNSFDSTDVSDYLHINAIDVDPTDGNIVMSFRHTSSIVKIDRHDAHIIWTFGGKEDQFGLTATQTFSFQHHVRMHPDGSMTVFDNGNQSMPVQTRALSFVLDQTSKKVTSFEVLYSRPSGQPQTGFMGSATKLANGDYLYGWGGWFDSTGMLSKVIAPAATEISGGAPVWSLTFTTPATFSYRALPITAP